MDSSTRTCFLELERMIKEGHIKTLKAIPKPKPNQDFEHILKKIDSLQKQINHLKHYKRDFDEMEKRVKQDERDKAKALRKINSTMDRLEKALGRIQK